MRNRKVKMVIMILALGMLLYCVFLKAKHIEQELYEKSVRALRKQHISSTVLSFHGRDVILHGVVNTPQEKENIERIVLGVRGVRTVANRLSIRKVFTGNSDEYRVETKPENTPTDRLTALEELKEFLSSQRIYFLPNSYQLSEEGINTLRNIANRLRGYSDVTIEISGYADSSGSDSLNLFLSRQRARTVFDFLKKEHLSGIRFLVQGYGSQSPLTSNSTTRGRIINRRVEFKIKEKN